MSIKYYIDDYDMLSGTEKAWVTIGLHTAIRRLAETAIALREEEPEGIDLLRKAVSSLRALADEASPPEPPQVRVRHFVEALGNGQTP